MRDSKRSITASKGPVCENWSRSRYLAHRNALISYHGIFRLYPLGNGNLFLQPESIYIFACLIHI